MPEDRLRHSIVQEMPDVAQSAGEQDCFPPDESPSFLIQLLARLLTKDYMARISALGIAPAQTFVIRELLRHQPQTQAALARRLNIGNPAVGETVSRLEREGIVTRRASSSDRRATMIQLTRKGEALKPELVRASREQFELVRELLGAEIHAELTKDLKTLVDAFDTSLNG